MSEVQLVEVAYIVLRFYVRPLAQEEGDGGLMTIVSRMMESSGSIL